MATQTVQTTLGEAPRSGARPADPCLMVIFGASGDLTKRLLMPALYNLACDRLLPEHFALIGISLTELTTEQFRDGMSKDIKTFTTRKTFDQKVWDQLVNRLHYTPGNFGDAEAYRRLAELIAKLDAQHQTAGNVLFYLATPPSVFALIGENLDRHGLKAVGKGWKRLIVEKPFGHDMASALELNRKLLPHWSENQIYRIDHYLGKETVQNLLAFRFANGIFEPLWNKNYIDNIQFTVAETVGVEGRGKYYDGVGVLRDMIQNHMFQMLAYLCMEAPGSFQPEAIRNEKGKVLECVRVWKPEEVPLHVVRGQYGPGKHPDGTKAVGYREEPDVAKDSRTETFAALELFIDNWRWEGVPIYLRSGKALWKRGTEIVVQFRKAPEVLFRGTPSADLVEPNKLLFHIQPDQGIEFRFHAKTPGPNLFLQKVNMRFDYQEAFEAARGTGYEVLLYHAMIGDATLFSRTDLVESAWRIAQPIMDSWAARTPTDYPNYPAGTWGPKAGYDLIERGGRNWLEVINRSVLERVPLFAGCDAIFLNTLAMALKADVCAPGDTIIRQGETGEDMYFVSRGQVEVVDKTGKVVATLGEGAFFGEIALLLSQPRTATVRAVTNCDLFILQKGDFQRVLADNPRFATAVQEAARTRYQVPPPKD